MFNDMSVSNSINAEDNSSDAATALNNNSSCIGGRRVEMILIQRYRSLDRNVNAALSNAAQDPGETAFFIYHITLLKANTNMSATLTGLCSNPFLWRIAKSDINRKVKVDEVRPPHIYDVLMMLTQDKSQESTDETMNPCELCVFMSGFENEAEEFLRLSPRFFFIICDVIGVNNDHPQQWNSIRGRTQLVVPVILRGGYYYIICGQQNVPVYRIHHPEQFFFSADGRTLLLSMLHYWHCDKKGGMLEVLFTCDGKHSLYCVPKVASNSGYPNELWNDLTEDQIQSNIPFKLVHEPLVENDHMYSVQLVRLDDSNNIVDIVFPDMS